VNALNDVLSGIRHKGSLDANDLAVHQLSFLNVLYFEINSTFIGLIYPVVMFGSYVHKKYGFLIAAFFFVVWKVVKSWMFI
jgi:hypothetical protein